METLWKVRQRNVLCDEKIFKLALKKKKIVGLNFVKIKKMFKNDFSQQNARILIFLVEKLKIEYISVLPLI